MATGCACPSCGIGVTPAAGLPCRQCETGAGRGLAGFLRRLGGLEPRLASIGPCDGAVAQRQPDREAGS
jgi:hypothetical protein